jgi:hypothetical protein
VTRDNVVVSTLSGFSSVIPRAAIIRTEVSTETHAIEGTGFLIGALTGGALGAGLDFAIGQPDASCTYFCISQAKMALGMGTLLGVAGGVIGLIAGSRARSDTWQPSSLTLLPSFSVNRPGLSLTFGR